MGIKSLLIAILPLLVVNSIALIKAQVTAHTV